MYIKQWETFNGSMKLYILVGNILSGNLYMLTSYICKLMPYL